MTLLQYAIVGSWSDRQCKKGLNVYKYDGNGNLQFIETYFDDVKVGHQIYDKKTNIIYFVDEVQHPNELKIGGGGYVLAAKFDINTGKMTLLSKKKTLCVKPDFVTYDCDRRYLIVVHHASTKDTITKLKKDNAGQVTNEVIFDDVATVMFKLNDDGSIGEICDYYLHKDINYLGANPSHLHSIYPSPMFDFYAVCDKGLNRIYSFQIDKEENKLILINTLQVESERSPRYGVFHPIKHIFYSNNEKIPYLSMYEYRKEYGIVKKIKEIYLLDNIDDKDKKATASDIKFSKDYKHLYVALRYINRIVMLDVCETGDVILRQSIDIGGENTRGIEIDPNGKYLFACNTNTNNITKFEIDENGYLKKVNKEIILNYPANIIFID